MYYMFLTDEAAEKVRALGNVISVRRYIYTPNTDVFRSGRNRAGARTTTGRSGFRQRAPRCSLRPKTCPCTAASSKPTKGTNSKNATAASTSTAPRPRSYTFAMDYYWMMGDNRHNSADSRFWGFVPEDHIVGKASFVWLSLDANKSFPSNIRWERLFKKVR